MSSIIFEERLTIPDCRDLDSFREWAKSDEMPREGRFAFINGTLWMDLSMEELFRHNGLLSAFQFTLKGLRPAPRGYFFWQRVLYTNQAAGLSTEPDGLFVSFGTIQDGSAELVRDAEDEVREIQGRVNMALEAVSKTSVRKDTVELRESYHRAGVGEYWLIDARRSPARIEILRHAPEGYVAVEPVDGWLRSDVFGRSFRLEESTDPLGNPQYTLAVQ